MLPIKNDPRKWESRDCKAAFIATHCWHSVLCFWFLLFFSIRTQKAGVFFNIKALCWSCLTSFFVFHKVNGQQRPPFSKGKSNFCCPQKDSSPALEQNAELCPKHLVLRNVLRDTRKEAENKNIKKQAKNLLFKHPHLAETCSVWSWQPLARCILSWCVWKCLGGHLKEFTLDFSGILLRPKLDVLVQLMLFSVRYLLWDPFSCKLNSLVCLVMLTLHHLLQNYRRLRSDNIRSVKGSCPWVRKAAFPWGPL